MPKGIGYKSGGASKKAAPKQSQGKKSVAKTSKRK